MDHSVKAMSPHRKVAFSRLLNRQRFENDELEALYQRYIFKLQQASIVSALALFVLLTAVLAVLEFVYSEGLTVSNVYHLIHCAVFSTMLVFLHTRWMQDGHAIVICYVILAFCVLFGVASFPVDFGVTTKAPIPSAADGVWQIVFVTFTSYSMLPLRPYVSLVVGVVLPLAHILLVIFLVKEASEYLWQQVRTRWIFFYRFSLLGRK